MANVKKDLVFLCQFFYPEYNSSAILPFDTAKYLADKGLQVVALCGYPKEYREKSDPIPMQEQKDGVWIRRLKYIQVKRGRKLGRLVNYFSFTAAVLSKVFVLKKYQAVLVYSNPPILPIAALLAHKLWKIKIIFVSYDVYPEVAYASQNLTETGLIARVMRRINHSLFQKASAIVTLTEEMKQFLLENRPELKEERVAVIPNWAHEKSRNAQTEYYEKFGYSPKDFIVSYFGNMGICQDMETVIRAVELLQEHKTIRFFLVGHGCKKEQIKERTAELQNVQVLDALTGTEFEEAVSISSCGIVSLEHGVKGTCAPSKYYSYLKGGLPVLAITEADSYLAEEIRREKIGYVIPDKKGETLSKAIQEMSLNREQTEKMGQRARQLYGTGYEMEKSLEKYTKLIEQVLKEERNVM